MKNLLIREAKDSDLPDVLSVERAAFGQEEEAELVEKLLADPSAQPSLSLLAFLDDCAVGHILFTKARLIEPQNAISVVLLAPLAVVPDTQRQGIGGKLIAKGIELLSAAHVDLIFVLGHPSYYPRHGFRPAGQFGLDAPYPMPAEQDDAWMVQALRPDMIENVRGKVLCADALNRPEYWHE